MTGTDLKLKILKLIDELSETVTANLDQYHAELMTDKVFRDINEHFALCLYGSIGIAEAMIADINNADDLPFTL